MAGTVADTIIIGRDVLYKVVGWSVSYAAAASLASLVLGDGADFAIACMLLSGIDAGIMLLWLRRLNFDEVGQAGSISGAFVTSRAVLKALALLLAWALGGQAVFVGAVVGALSFELAMITAGPVIAAHGTFRTDSSVRG